MGVTEDMDDLSAYCQILTKFLKPRIRCTYGLRLYYVDKTMTGSYIRIMGEIN